VRRAGEQARKLVDQLLTLSRRRVVQPVVLDPNETVTSLGEVLRRLVGAHIDVELRPAKVGTVVMDPSQLEQVFLNLVVNARDAMPDGGKLIISTGTGQLPDGVPAVTLTVADNGCGMDAETAARVFEPFFTTKSRAEGTGLGLATVYAIVTQSGGEISVQTEPGAGATFVVKLPRGDLPVVDLRVEPEVPGGSETVMLVEDEEQVRAYASQVLRDGGYTVIDAPSGRDAIELVNGAIVPDLLVTDVVMPGMGGVELARWFDERAPGMSVLFVSGYAEDPTLHGIRDVPFLPKPFSSQQLLRAVRDALDTSSSASPSR
jgi:CheY-like chemotaxis protein